MQLDPADDDEGTVIIGNVTIGDNSVIGSGPVVTKDSPARVLVMRNPTRVIREIEDKVNK